MSRIRPAAQVLIDRLAAMDAASFPQDRATIERAFTYHLRALGLPDRPVEWAENARAGCQIIAKQMAIGTVTDAASEARDAAWDAAGAVVREVRGNECAAWDAARDASRVVGQALDAVWEACHAGSAMARDAFGDAIMAVSEINNFASFGHPTTAALAAIWLPIFEAFEAGLFFYRVTPCNVVCVLQPSLSVSNGRLHRSDGPAVWWDSGEQYFFWRGVQVHAWIIEEPSRITLETIEAECDPEVQRCMIEIRDHRGKDDATEPRA